jgi:hypothetical protein
LCKLSVWVINHTKTHSIEKKHMLEKKQGLVLIAALAAIAIGLRYLLKVILAEKAIETIRCSGTGPQCGVDQEAYCGLQSLYKWTCAPTMKSFDMCTKQDIKDLKCIPPSMKSCTSEGIAQCEAYNNSEECSGKRKVCKQGETLKCVDRKWMCFGQGCLEKGHSNNSVSLGDFHVASKSQKNPSVFDKKPKNYKEISDKKKCAWVCQGNKNTQLGYTQATKWMCIDQKELKNANMCKGAMIPQDCKHDYVCRQVKGTFAYVCKTPTSRDAVLRNFSLLVEYFPLATGYTAPTTWIKGPKTNQYAVVLELSSIRSLSNIKPIFPTVNCYVSTTYGGGIPSFRPYMTSAEIALINNPKATFVTEGGIIKLIPIDINPITATQNLTKVCSLNRTQACVTDAVCLQKQMGRCIPAQQLVKVTDKNYSYVCPVPRPNVHHGAPIYDDDTYGHTYAWAKDEPYPCRGTGVARNKTDSQPKPCGEQINLSTSMRVPNTVLKNNRTCQDIFHSTGSWKKTKTKTKTEDVTCCISPGVSTYKFHDQRPSAYLEPRGTQTTNHTKVKSTSDACICYGSATNPAWTPHTNKNKKEDPYCTLVPKLVPETYKSHTATGRKKDRYLFTNQKSCHGGWGDRVYGGDQSDYAYYGNYTPQCDHCEVPGMKPTKGARNWTRVWSWDINKNTDIYVKNWLTGKNYLRPRFTMHNKCRANKAEKVSPKLQQILEDKENWAERQSVSVASEFCDQHLPSKRSYQDNSIAWDSWDTKWGLYCNTRIIPPTPTPALMTPWSSGSTEGYTQLNGVYPCQECLNRNAHDDKNTHGSKDNNNTWSWSWQHGTCMKGPRPTEEHNTCVGPSCACTSCKKTSCRPCIAGKSSTNTNKNCSIHATTPNGCQALNKGQATDYYWCYADGMCHQNGDQQTACPAAKDDAAVGANSSCANPDDPRCQLLIETQGDMSLGNIQKCLTNEGRDDPRCQLLIETQGDMSLGNINKCLSKKGRWNWKRGQCHNGVPDKGFKCTGHGCKCHLNPYNKITTSNLWTMVKNIKHSSGCLHPGTIDGCLAASAANVSTNYTKWCYASNTCQGKRAYTCNYPVDQRAVGPYGSESGAAFTTEQFTDQKNPTQRKAPYLYTYSGGATCGKGKKTQTLCSAKNKC